tara:strand:+ start:2357 stop:2476 length:120 start_codon:yes stop_codon:yes gene_type:complete
LETQEKQSNLSAAYFGLGQLSDLNLTQLPHAEVLFNDFL